MREQSYPGVSYLPPRLGARSGDDPLLYWDHREDQGCGKDAPEPDRADQWLVPLAAGAENGGPTGATVHAASFLSVRILHDVEGGGTGRDGGAFGEVHFGRDDVDGG
ncbi:hypothetical protein V2J09_023209 [Rumex salicifolius]